MCFFSSAAQRQKVKGWGLKGDGWTSVAETQSVSPGACVVAAAVLLYGLAGCKEMGVFLQD